MGGPARRQAIITEPGFIHLGALGAPRVYTVHKTRLDSKNMRSSKSRSRSRPSRGRTQAVGNVVNRVFDSSGPEGKVRGTPQQIIEKYNQLARDAQLSNDRVATENFQQHAEHYLRLLGEAQKEIDARREQQERENRDRQAERDRERPQQRNGSDAGSSPQPDVAEVKSEDDTSTLVETPESKAPPKRAPRKPRQKATPESDAPAAEETKSDDAEDSASAPAKPQPRPRRPRAPKVEADKSEAPDDSKKASDATAE